MWLTRGFHVTCGARRRVVWGILGGGLGVGSGGGLAALSVGLGVGCDFPSVVGAGLCGHPAIIQGGLERRLEIHRVVIVPRHPVSQTAAVHPAEPMALRERLIAGLPLSENSLEPKRRRECRW